jgi:Tfp pilus assembly protein PilO
MARRSEIRGKDVLTTVLMLAGTCAVAASVYMTFIAGVAGKEARLEAELQKRKKELQEFQQLNQEESTLKAALESSTTVMGPLWERVTRDNEAPEEVLRLLYETAMGERIVLESAKHNRESALNDVFRLSAYDVSALGDYHNLGRFLHSLEAKRGLLRVHGLKLATGKDGKVKATFELLIHSLRESTGSGT